MKRCENFQILCFASKNYPWNFFIKNTSHETFFLKKHVVSSYKQCKSNISFIVSCLIKQVVPAAS